MSRHRHHHHGNSRDECYEENCKKAYLRQCEIEQASTAYKPIGNGAVGHMLNQDLLPGESATVWNVGYPHAGHTDAILYQKGVDGRVRPIDKHHLSGETLYDKYKR